MKHEVCFGDRDSNPDPVLAHTNGMFPPVRWRSLAFGITVQAGQRSGDGVLNPAR